MKRILGIGFGLASAVLAVACSKSSSNSTVAKGMPMTCSDQLSGGEWHAVTPAPKEWTHGGGEAIAGPMMAYIHEKGSYVFFGSPGRWEQWAPDWSNQGSGEPLLIDDGTFVVKTEGSGSCVLEVSSAHPSPDEPKQQLWPLRFDSTDRFTLGPSEPSPVVYQRRMTKIAGPGTSKKPSLAAGSTATAPDGDTGQADDTDIYAGIPLQPKTAPKKGH
jgi:hypothetical protein